MSKVVLRLTGVLFLAVIAGLVGLTVLIYDKAFTPVVEVTLEADRAGNQLTAPADVKLRGLIVGSVREISSTGGGATLRLALEPDKVHLIPSDVRARLLPKTLFGEKFVDLVAPDRSTGRSLRAGDVIGQDRSTTALETEKVLSDLMPLLRTLRPQQLSLTLNAVSGALRGRGEQIGANLEALDTYLARLNPEMPTLQHDLRGLAALSETFDAAAPDVLAVLDNFSAVSRNLVDQKQELATFLAATTRSTGTLDDVLSENERRLVQLASSSRPSLELLATYAPEFPCLLQGLSTYESTVSSTFGGKQPGLHITLEQTTDNNGYVKGDEPAYGDTRAPYCNGLPHPSVPQGGMDFRDGYRDTASSGPGGTTAATASNDPALFLSGAADPAAADRDVLAAVTAPVLGVRAAAVPDLVDLLFGPMARGTKVGLA